MIAARQFAARLLRRLMPPTETLDGYEQPELVELIFQKTIAYKPQNDWPEMAGVSSVLDFGGGCGLHYKQARSPTVRWAVVETPAMVARASGLRTDKLRFFTSIAEAANWLGPFDVMHSNGALHYSEDPEQTLSQLCSLRARTMLWQRVYLSQGDTERAIQVSNLVDNGPGKAARSVKNKAVKYEYTKIPEPVFLAAHDDYTLADRGADWVRFTLK
jgi:putative methyltransferase (TIGR04325 family)